MYGVEIVTDPAGFRVLSKEWNELLEEHSSEDSVFLRHEWFLCLWESCMDAASLYLILVREDGRLIGIAPLMKRRISFRGMPARVVTFIENEKTLHCDFITDKEKRAEALDAVFSELDKRGGEWDIVEINRLPKDSLNSSALRGVFRKRKGLFGEKNGYSSPYIKIGSDWESYLKGRSRKAKKTLRNIQNRFERSGDFQIRKIDSYEEYLEVKNELYDIAKKSWSEDFGRSLYSDINREFFDALSRVAGKGEWLQVWLLKYDGVPAAFEYHLRYKGRVYGMKASYKKEFGDMSPGVFLDYHIVKELFEGGNMHEYDMGGDADFYKRKWTGESRGHITFHLFKRNLYSGLLRMIEYSLVPAVKKMVRKQESEGAN